MVDMEVKRGDLLPPFVAYLTNGTDPDTGADIPVDLTSASAIKINAWRNNVSLFSRTSPTGVSVPTGADALAGKVTMAWQAPDTATAADLYMEVEVQFSGSKPQTFPRKGWFVVRVGLDLG